jgi:hypothetical protein
MTLAATRLHEVLHQARLSVLPPLSAASLDSYERSYGHIVFLHMLHEVEWTWRTVGVCVARRAGWFDSAVAGAGGAVAAALFSHNLFVALPCSWISSCP